MALKKDISLKNNFGEQTKVKDVYIKVSEVLFTKNKAIGKVQFLKAKEDLPFHIDTIVFDASVGVDSKNAIAQGYDYIKTLPDFDGAVDC